MKTGGETLETFAQQLDDALARGEVSEPDAQRFLDNLFSIAEQTGIDGNAVLPSDISASLRDKFHALCHQNV